MSNVITCLKERGLIDAQTSEDLLQRAERPLKIYIGFDPTADSLHVGNLVGIIFLRWFQKFGHTPVIILGGATGRIGDPSGKSIERPLLDQETIAKNVARIRSHFERVLDFSHPTAAPIMLNNDEWFASYFLIDFLRDVGKHFRVGVMLGKESVRSRLESEEGISFTEFSYQLLQAYDFYYLRQNYGVELQAGGSDQWGNITAGIELVRKITGESAYGLTFPLLTRSDGKKFGKTEGGAIWLAADRCSPYQFYQYFIRMPDADIVKMMKMLTFMPLEEIQGYERKLSEPETPPNFAQKRLAEELTRMIHGEEGLAMALKVTEGIAPGADAVLDVTVLQEISSDMPHKSLLRNEVMGCRWIEIAVLIDLTTSRSKATRLIESGGAYLNNQRIDDPSHRLKEEDLIGGKYLLFGSGKKKKILVSVGGN